MLSDIQKRLDTSSWDRSNHALVPDFKNLDLTQQGELIFESDLEWRQVHYGWKLYEMDPRSYPEQKPLSHKLGSE